MNETIPFPPAVTHRFSNAADIHSHVLPNIDDGAHNIDESLQMARMAARYGTSLIVATSHRYFAGRENTPDLLREKAAEVRDALAQTKLGRHIEVVVGQEIPLRWETSDELTAGKLMTLGDTGVCALVEPPFDLLPDWTPYALKNIVDAGFQPIFAHPERNGMIQDTPELTLPLVESGALLQVNAMSILGDNGPNAQNAAFWLLNRNFVTVIASDAHSPSPTYRPPILRAAYHVVRARYGQERADALCIHNPRAIAQGKDVQAFRYSGVQVLGAE